MHDHPRYYHPDDLANFGEIGRSCEDLARKFFDWYGAVFADGALSARVHVAAAIRGGASLIHGVQMRPHVAKVGM